MFNRGGFVHDLVDVVVEDFSTVKFVNSYGRLLFLHFSLYPSTYNYYLFEKQEDLNIGIIDAAFNCLPRSFRKYRFFISGKFRSRIG